MDRGAWVGYNPWGRRELDTVCDSTTGLLQSLTKWELWFFHLSESHFRTQSGRSPARVVHTSIFPSQLPFLASMELILGALWLRVGIIVCLNGPAASVEVRKGWNIPTEGDRCLAILNKLTTQATSPGAISSLEPGCTLAFREGL